MGKRHQPRQALHPQTTKKATTILRSRTIPAIYALTIVYTAALCGWQLNGNDDPISILLHLIMLAGATLLAYGIAQERENQK